MQALNGARMTQYQWKSDWTTLNQNQWHKTHWMGCEMDWDVQWNRNPDDNSKQGLFAELVMQPETVENDHGKIDFHFNPSNATVESYRPGNTVGTSSNSWTLGVGSDSVGFSLSQSRTGSNLDVDMVGDTVNGDEDVEHKYTISGDIRENQLVLNSAAVATVDEVSGETFANIDLIGKWGPHSIYALGNGYKYYWD